MRFKNLKELFNGFPPTEREVMLDISLKIKEKFKFKDANDLRTLLMSVNTTPNGFLPEIIENAGFVKWIFENMVGKNEEDLLGLKYSSSDITYIIKMCIDIILLDITIRILGKITASEEEEDTSYPYLEIIEIIKKNLDVERGRFIQGARVNCKNLILSGLDTEYRCLKFKSNELLSIQLTTATALKISFTNMGFPSVGIHSKEDMGLKRLIGMLYYKLILVHDILNGSQVESFFNQLKNVKGLKHVKWKKQDVFLTPFKEEEKDVTGYKVQRRLIINEDYSDYSVGSNTPIEYFSKIPSISEIVKKIKNMGLEDGKENWEEFMKMCKETEVEDMNDYRNVILKTGIRLGEELEGVVKKYFEEEEDLNEYNHPILKKDNDWPKKWLKNMSNERVNWKNLRGSFFLTTEVNIGAHYAIADFSIFTDFNEYIRKMDKMHKSVSSLIKGFRVSDCYVRVIETMSLTPGQGSLVAVGSIVNLKKIELKDKEDLRLLMKKNFNDFAEYAIRDVEIVLKYMVQIFTFGLEKTGCPQIIPSLASLSVLWGLKQIDAKILKTIQKGQDPRRLKGRIQSGLNEYLESFMGGRNECFTYGINKEDVWYDYDIKSAYTSVLSSLGVPLLEKMHKISDPKKWVSTKNFDENFSVFRLKFTFPEDHKFPSIPVRTENGIIYPSSGYSVINGFELKTALRLGVKIEEIEGTAVPLLKNEEKEVIRPFKDLISLILKLRGEHPKGSFTNLMYKEIGNSFYGKMAQGLSDKKSFSFKHNLLTSISPSKITNVIIVSTITSIIRATLSELIFTAWKNGGVVASATTDGLLCTNKNLMEIVSSSDLPAIQYLKNAQGVKEILELKHQTNGLITVKTRMAAGSAESGLKAATGYRASGEGLYKDLKNLFESGQQFKFFAGDYLRTSGDIYKEGGSVTPKISVKTLNIKNDCKRRIIGDTHPRFGMLESKPQRDINNYYNDRKRRDLSIFFRPSKPFPKDYKRIFISSFISEYKEVLNMPYEELIRIFKEEIKVKISKEFIGMCQINLYPIVKIPNCQEVQYMKDKISARFPNLDLERFIGSNK